ncbi:hypothetical protein FEM48_Zijuj08G0175400 [Ziziphus jujuba var. spinosa]|uniref:Uncharacterized protein n=1 Tax=Ziziphus jujuba var. spinosa TaxID=714518 RepID=A0A978V0F5_ZIZJJ|nr:hypothetical protein FEM48_Zijuj08G0175400 [Ziziphus jujuba var. spinosa]
MKLYNNETIYWYSIATSVISLEYLYLSCSLESVEILSTLIGVTWDKMVIPKTMEEIGGDYEDHILHLFLNLALRCIYG